MLEERKKIFNNFSEEYDRYRPDYPKEMFDDIVEYSSLKSGDEIFEIGCGTGKATQGFINLGFKNLTCVEFGDKLAEFTKNKFLHVDSLNIINGDFEKIDIEPSKYKLAFCATAFHFLKPEIAYTKIHNMLLENGVLAIFWNMSVNDGSYRYEAIRQTFIRHAPHIRTFTADSSESTVDEMIDRRCDEISATGLYRDIFVKNYVRKIPHTSKDYISLLKTHSPNALLDLSTQERLYSDIENIILENDNLFEEKLLTTCYMMRKKN